MTNQLIVPVYIKIKFLSAMKIVTIIVTLASSFLFVNTVVAKEANTFYIGIFGGSADSVFGSPKNGDSDAGRAYDGSIFAGSIYNNDLNLSHVVGAEVGWLLSDKWRFDLAYYNLGGDMDWTTDINWTTLDDEFAVSDHIFAADFQSHLILVNAYFSPIILGKFKPYVGVGIGVAVNKLSSIVGPYAAASIGNLGFSSFVESDTTTKLAYRLAFGLEYLLNERWILGLDFSFINIGGFSSGSAGKFINGHLETENEFGVDVENEFGVDVLGDKFEDVWIRSITLGLKYIF